MPKTWLDKQTTKDRANTQEKKLAKTISATLTPNSGATTHYKGDMATEDFLIESKSTENKSMSIQQEWLKKIEIQAMREGKLPMLIIDFGDTQYCVLRRVDVF